MLLIAHAIDLMTLSISEILSRIRVCKMHIMIDWDGSCDWLVCLSVLCIYTVGNWGKSLPAPVVTWSKRPKHWLIWQICFDNKTFASKCQPKYQTAGGASRIHAEGRPVLSPPSRYLPPADQDKAVDLDNIFYTRTQFFNKVESWKNCQVLCVYILHLNSNFLSIISVLFPPPINYKPSTTSLNNNLLLSRRIMLITQHRLRQVPSFPRFQELPTEIRLQVWQSAFPRGTGPTEHRRITFDCYYGLTITTASTLVVFHVNQESRCEALRNYQLLFDKMEGVTPMYYNPKLDIVYLEVHGLQCNPRYLRRLQGNFPSQLYAIQTLEIYDQNNSSPIDARHHWSTLTGSVLQFFPRLMFLNIFHACSSTASIEWRDPNTANISLYQDRIIDVKEDIRKIQLEDPSWLMPSIRYAPVNDCIELIKQWPAERQLGPLGQDLFTDIEK